MLIDNSWLKYIKDEFKKPYFIHIKQFLEEEKNKWKIIYPKEEYILNALNITKFNNIKVVILWQDPYHRKNQANWLSFSVQNWVKIPPSLKNIFKELKNDLGKEIPKSWDLTDWAKQWVLLLNSIFTVEEWKATSHSKINWQNFSDKIIEIISKEKTWIIFILWWNFAISKIKLIDKNKHFILTSSHPSPFSAHKWFFWSKVFSKTNKILKQIWEKQISF